jgi:hypothetical protein
LAASSDARFVGRLTVRRVGPRCNGTVTHPRPAATMCTRSKLVLALLAMLIAAAPARADKTTVCTITVNSADEKEAFRRSLPPDKYRFVELVEHGRADWLSSACRAGVQCDMLIISGHYDGGNEFFSEYVEASEFLPVAELERVSCSGSCPGLFSRLKEVYLFGCNTLNPEAQRSVSANAVATLVQGGLPKAEAERVVRSLNARYGESSRDRMRLVFNDVPVIYGFSSVAPLGPTAGNPQSLFPDRRHERDRDRAREPASAGTVLGAFAHRDTRDDRHRSLAGVRRDVCQFADDRSPLPARSLSSTNFCNGQCRKCGCSWTRIERYVATLDDRDRQDRDVAEALAAIGHDEPTRARYLAYARDADPAAFRAHMLGLAGDLGWLTAEEHRTEIVRLFGDLLARDGAGPAEVDLACTLNREHEFDGLYDDAENRPRADDAAHAALRACLGSEEGHARTLEALVGTSDADARVAQAYLRHRPITAVGELRTLTAGIAQMRGSEAQVRALQTLAGHRVADPESLEALAQLFPQAESWSVQSAIAGVLIRADYRSIARPEIVQALRDHRRNPLTGLMSLTPSSGACNNPDAISVIAVRQSFKQAAAAARMARIGRLAVRPSGIVQYSRVFIAPSLPAHARTAPSGLPSRVPRVAAGRARRSENCVHHHGQFRRREADLRAIPSARRLPVRRAGRARTPGLARFRLPESRQMRRAHRVGPLRRRHRVLYRPPRCPRVAARARARARFVQRVVPRIVLAAEGSLSFRLQYPQCG